ncbi:hypothetical protein JCM3766R1_003785 [Sporobolomyces carnicolor]
MVSQTEGTWWSRNRAAAEDLVTFVRLHSWKDTLRNSFRLKYLAWWILAIVTVVVAVALAFYRDTIVGLIQPQRQAIVEFPFSWIFPLLAMILLSATPFTGRHIVLIAVGLIYEIKVALATSVVGIVLGEALCYFVFKSLFAKRAAKIEQKNLFYAAVALSQRQSGVILCVRALLFLEDSLPTPSSARFDPPTADSFVPSRVVSATQAISGLSFIKFMAAVVISMPKQLSEVWLGSLIGGNPDPSKRNQHTVITVLILAVTGIAGTIALYEVYMRARRFYPQLRAQRSGTDCDQDVTTSSGDSDSDHFESASRGRNEKEPLSSCDAKEERIYENSRFVATAR